MIGQRPSQPVELRPWRELAVFTLIALELCWIALWFSNLTQINHPVSYSRAYLVLGGLMLSSHLLARGLHRAVQRPAVRRTFDLGLLILGLWLALELLLYLPDWPSPSAIWGRVVGGFAEQNTIPPEFWVLLACLLIWNRGIAIAHKVVSAERSQASYELGILMFAVYGISIPFLPLHTALAALFALLVLGLISMSAARIYETGRRRGGRLAGFSPTWLAGIGMAALLVVGLGVLPASLLPPGLAQFAVRYLLVGVGLLVALVALILSPLIIILLIAVQAIGPFLAKVFDFLQISQLFQMLQNLDGSRNLSNPLAQIAVAKPVTLWAILLLVVFVILTGLSWRAWLERKTEKEEGELELSPADLMGWLRSKLRASANRFGRQNRLRWAAQLLATARVRWIYGQLMHLCVKLEHPRPPACTPLEFLPDLELLFPEQRQALGEITQAYVRVRYGEAPETVEQVERLSADWKQVSRAARGRKKR